MLNKFCENIKSNSFMDVAGRVLEVRGDSIKLSIPNVGVGAICEVKTSSKEVLIEIISLGTGGHVGMPLDSLNSVQLGDPVTLVAMESTISIHEGLLGSVIDSMGEPYFGSVTHNVQAESLKLSGDHLDPMEREIISEPLDLGIRSINACLTCGKGQRQGIFAGSGVGKSVLMGMLARHTEADVVVIGLIGERGREVREFIEKDLGAEGRKKSVVVVETSDRSAIRRVRGAFVSTAIAEFYRKKGKNVLLLMDSLTRFAMAQREIGMAAGEPPTTKGYTPSVFHLLAKLVERAGFWGPKGSITGLYTVLVEGDDMEDPVADAVRSLLDGHIVLSRSLANRGHYPAVDLLASVSRTMDQVTSKEHIFASRELKKNLSKYADNEDAIQFGMYSKGSDQLIDRAIELEPKISEFLQQDRSEGVTIGDARSQLVDMLSVE